MNTASDLSNGNAVRTRWSLRLLGGFELGVLPGGDRVTSLGKRERVLLAYLALSPNCRQTRRKLATLLWGDANDDTLLSNLRACVWKLRKALGDNEHLIIASEGDDIVLDASAFEVDALAFRQLAAQSGRIELEAAAALCSGEFLDGLDIDSEEFEAWRRAEATRSRDQTIDALNRLMAQLAECGEIERATETGERILRLEPLHEAVARRLMRLYSERGRRGAAIHLYRTLADVLHTELAAQPEPETRAVFAEIARGGEEQANDWATIEATPAAPSTSMTRSSDVAREPYPISEQHLAIANRPGRQGTAGKLGWILAGGLAAVIAISTYYEVVPATSTATSQRPTGADAARPAPPSPAGAISIAVLPFTNLSGDASQEFFSDGMTEEITAALARVPNLQVVGRTSAFQFRDQNKDLSAIRQALGVRYLIDGSVRKEGTRVRITAQLVDADSGLNLWTESYDRQLTSVFTTQEDIAQAIAGALRVPLGLKPGQTLISNRIADPDIYEQYLRAEAQRRTSTGGARVTLETVVARAPSFAPAWASLAGAYRGAAADAGRSGDFKAALLLTDKMEAAARKAIQLDASYAGGYSELAAAKSRQGKWAEAEDFYRKALSLDPNDSDLLHVYSQTLAAVGRLKEALRLRERLTALDPLVPSYNQITARILFADGQTDESIAILEPDLSNGMRRNVYLAQAYASKGQFTDAADTLLRITSETDRRSVEDAARLLRSAPSKTATPKNLPALVAELGFVYAYIGAPERVLEYPEQAAKEGSPMAVSTIWRLAPSPVRKTERFKTLIRNAGLVDYWRARGWPDLCHPLGTEDFVCD